MKVSHYGAGVGIIEKIHHRAMTAGDENGVILIQARCDDIRDASWIFEPCQAVAKFEIVLKPGLVPAEEIGNSGVEIQLRSVAYRVGESDFVALAHQGADRNRQFVEIVAGTGINLAVFQGQAVTARDQHQNFSFCRHFALLFGIDESRRLIASPRCSQREGTETDIYWLDGQGGSHGTGYRFVSPNAWPRKQE